MTCKFCGKEISEDSKFCAHCGEKIVKKGRPSKKEEVPKQQEREEVREEKKEEQKILYREDVERAYWKNSSEEQNRRPIQYVEKNEVSTKNPCSIIGLVFFVIALVLLWYVPWLSMIFGLCSLILAAVGKKHANPALGTTSLVFSILGFVIVMIAAPILIIGNIRIDGGYGEKVTIFEYLKDVFYAEYYSDDVYGEWEVDGSSYLLVLGSSGDYILYLDKNNRENSYYYGQFDIDSGIENRRHDTQFADQNYYYYSIDTYNEQYYVDGTSNSDLKIFSNEVILKINKRNRSEGMLLIPGAQIELKIKTDYSHF